jgi:lysine 2,3-aminomutase
MAGSDFPHSPEAEAHRLRHHPGVDAATWNDWRWQLRHRLRDRAGLERVFRLSPGEAAALDRLAGGLPAALTPHYAALLPEDDPCDGLRRTKIPTPEEFQTGLDERDDPLGEEAHSPVPGIVHTYPYKALFLVTDHCATYCRYCTRARLVGGGELPADRARWEAGLEYLRAHPEIQDVLLSGGDPLLLGDDRLDALLQALRAIPHLRILRIGSKVPAVLPQRITTGLVEVLRRYHPLYLSLHFVHARELTPETAHACARLADAGLPLGGQMVLLKGVNDTPHQMRALCEGLLELRVRPYYLHQCDPIRGSAHFRTPVQTGLDLLRALHGVTTGYAIPHYMIDAPGGGGKVPVLPDYQRGREGDYLRLENYRGEIYRYWDGWQES